MINDVEQGPDDHLTVLNGVNDTCPAIPNNANHAGYLRHELQWNNDIDAISQRQDLFTFVWHLPIIYNHDKRVNESAPMCMQETFKIN